jgi:hypothetical protein
MKIARAPWKDAADLAGHSDWEKRATASGGRDDPDILRMHMVRGLVNEVVVAAGGIEREIRALKVAQALADANTAAIPDPVPRPETGPITVGPPGAALDSAYATMNALTWIRTVHERIWRKDKQGKQAGLLASLKDGEPNTTIDAEFTKLLPKLGDARKFDNYVLHGGALPGGQTPGFHMPPDRTVYFPFPDDPNTKRFFTWEQFAYKKNRKALCYIEDKFDAIATFIDSMLDAFDALPDTPTG